MGNTFNLLTRVVYITYDFITNLYTITLMDGVRGVYTVSMTPLGISQEITNIETPVNYIAARALLRYNIDHYVATVMDIENPVFSFNLPDEVYNPQIEPVFDTPYNMAIRADQDLWADLLKYPLDLNSINPNTGAFSFVDGTVFAYTDGNVFGFYNA